MGQLRFGYESLPWISYEPERYEVDRIAREIAKAGFGGIEFAHQLQHFARVPDLDAVMEELRLKLASLACSISYQSDDPMAETIARAEYAAAREVTDLMVVGGWGADWSDKSDDQLARLAHNLDAICERFRDRGLTTAFHPHLETCCENARDTARLLGFSKHTHLCLDNAHFDLTGDDSAAFAEAHADRIGLAHVKDFQPAPDEPASRYGGRFCELGEGQLDIERYLNALVQIGFDGWVIVELDRTVPTPLESARISAAWLRDHGFMD
jgi:sugar phosphate isomerase/epimerase